QRQQFAAGGAVVGVAQAVSAALHAQHATGAQCARHVGDDAGDEVGAALAFAHRVHGQVVDHRVEVARLRDPGERVADHDVGVRTVEGVAAQGRQVLAGQLHHPAVDLDHGELGRHRVE